MRFRDMLCLSAAVILLGAALPAQADVPQLINYQGVLQNSSGDPITTTVTVVFTIYDASTLGNNLWDEERQVTPGADGGFNINLGEVDNLTDAVFSTPDRWLGIKVGADPEMTPCMRLATVPYAFRAATVDGATGGAISGDVSIQSALSVSGDVEVVGGNIELDPSSIDAGNILKDGVPFIHDFGPANTFIGLSAGNFTMTGYENTATGVRALGNNTEGKKNTAYGHDVLRLNTTGDNNTASGKEALASNTEGHHNTAYGSGTLATNTIGNDNTATGANALHHNTNGNRNTANGYYALHNNTTGDYNTASGREALINNTTGHNNTAFGHGAGVSVGDLTNATGIGYNAVVDASNKIRLGNTAVTVIEGRVAYTWPSDKNEKENFRPVDGNEVLRKIRGLDLTSWNYIGHDPQQFRHYGPVAQEFFDAFGQDDVGTIGTPTTLNSGDMAGILMIAVQALEKRTAEVEDLRAQLAELHHLVDQLLEQNR